MSLPSLAEFQANALGNTTSLADILESFEFLDDWEERYSYIIDLGKLHPSFPSELKTEENYVHGCQSQVWLIHHLDADSGKHFFMIESDAIIVKGLAAVVLAMFNNKTSAEITQLDVDKTFEEIGLMRHISPTRGNGLRAMIELVKKHSA